jgi:hypothetical protein
MFANQVSRFYLVDPLVSQQIDQLPHFIVAQRKESSLLLVQCNFLAMSFLRRKTIKRSRKPVSTGYLMTKAKLKNKPRMSQN